MEALRQWFEENQRDLPWRRRTTPYEIWVSEVMLQQTQATVVIPYFLRWMEKFPTIKALANASEKEVIKAWEGLGYYARARHLHAGAKWVMEHYFGKLPSNEEELSRVKGLGPYTVGAIRSFAFHQKAPAVDGNVARVVARLYAMKVDVTSSVGLNLLRRKVAEFLPDSKPWVIMEALIELGALVCTKIPQCEKCPLQQQCLAYQEGKEKELPRRGKKVQYKVLKRFVAVIHTGDQWLIRREKRRQVMQGLWEFPYFEWEETSLSLKQRKKAIEELLSITCAFEKELDLVHHSFTRFRVQLFPSKWHCTKPVKVEGYEWMNSEAIKDLAFSAGHRRISKQVMR